MHLAIIHDLYAIAAALFLIPAVVIHAGSTAKRSLAQNLALIAMYLISFGFFVISLAF